ncbi:MAG: hypothetical protein KJ593_01435 [Candidatus Omnitrophica bacterium]|nr:hypothetical protein [Candidatus Omnitrophota bacterium]
MLRGYLKDARKIIIENENLIRGTNPDLRQRLREAGYRIALVPETWAYHPAPGNFLELISVFLRKAYVQLGFSRIIQSWFMRRLSMSSLNLWVR